MGDVELNAYPSTDNADALAAHPSGGMCVAAPQVVRDWSYGTLGIDAPEPPGKSEKTTNSADSPIMTATDTHAMRL